MQGVYSYPRTPRLRNAFDLIVWGWLVAAGVYFVLAYPLPSWRAYLAVGLAVAYFGSLCYLRGRDQVVLSRTFELLDQGLRITQWGKELVTIPWSAIDEIRDVGRQGNILIVSAFVRRPLLVHRRLSGLEEFRVALRRHATSPAFHREQPS